MSPAFAIELDRPEATPYRPGDCVRGRVQVTQGGGSRNLTVALQLRERSPDYTAIGASCGGEPVHSGELVEGTSFDFAIELPGDAPPGYRSAHAELRWEVEAWSDERGIDTREQLPFDVTA